MSLLDFGDNCTTARPGSPSTESMVSFETDSLASFEFNSGESAANHHAFDNHHHGMGVGDLLSPFTNAALHSFDNHLKNNGTTGGSNTNSIQPFIHSFHSTSAFTTPRHGSFSAASSSSVSSSSSSSVSSGSVCSLSSFNDNSSVLSMLDIGVLNVDGSAPSLNAITNAPDLLGRGPLSFSPESLLVKPDEVVCMPSVVDPPTNIVVEEEEEEEDDDENNDEDDEVGGKDDDYEEDLTPVNNKKIAIEFEYNLRSSKVMTATRAPPPTATNTTPSSLPAYANIIGDNNAETASSSSTNSTALCRDNSSSSLDQFRSQLMIVKLNFLKRKKISPSPLPASVAPIPAIFDHDFDASLVNDVKKAAINVMGPPPRRQHLRSAMLESNFNNTNIDICSENMSPVAAATPTPFDKNNKKRRRTTKGSSFTTTSSPKSGGILKTALNSPMSSNVNTNKKNSNVPSFYLPASAFFKLDSSQISSSSSSSTFATGRRTRNSVNAAVFANDVYNGKNNSSSKAAIKARVSRV